MVHHGLHWGTGGEPEVQELSEDEGSRGQQQCRQPHQAGSRLKRVGLGVLRVCNVLLCTAGAVLIVGIARNGSSKRRKEGASASARMQLAAAGQTGALLLQGIRARKTPPTVSVEGVRAAYRCLGGPEEYRARQEGNYHNGASFKLAD